MQSSTPKLLVWVFLASTTQAPPLPLSVPALFERLAARVPECVLPVSSGAGHFPGGSTATTASFPDLSRDAIGKGRARRIELPRSSQPRVRHAGGAAGAPGGAVVAANCFWMNPSLWGSDSAEKSRFPGFCGVCRPSDYSYPRSRVLCFSFFCSFTVEPRGRARRESLISKCIPGGVACPSLAAGVRRGGASRR